MSELPINQVVCGDCRKVIHEWQAESVDLFVTSPPYFNAREYSHWQNYEEYLSDLLSTWRECYRVLKVGGRIAVNCCHGYGRQPYIPVGSDITKQLQSFFLLKGHIIWDKGTIGGVRQATSWGSWLSASDPYLRDTHELIIIGSKEQSNKGYRGRSDIERDEFLQWTESIWRFPAESATRIGHPAPFPVELPKRLIKLYSYVSDIVVDPFVGSGTTLVACRQLRRRYIGIDLNPDYCEMARKRLTEIERPLEAYA